MLRYFHQSPNKITTESSVQDTSGVVLTSKLNNINSTLVNKVDKATGKELSSNNFTDGAKLKLSNIEYGAQVNVQSDWDTIDNTDDSYIKNKPEALPASDVYDWAKQPSKPTYTKAEIGLSNVTNDAQVKRSEMGTANGVATLDESGTVYSQQLPSYVDDVLEYSGVRSFPTVGESGKIYVDTNTNLTYRWSGSTYVEISPSLALGETATTAYAGNKGKALADTINNTSNKAATLSWGNATTLAVVNGINITAALPANPNTNIITSVVGKIGAITTALIATALTDGGYKLTDTDTNTVTTINGKSGAIAASDIAAVLTAANYKLTDTNTTYSAGTGLSLTGTSFALATSGVTAGTYGPSANVNGSNGATISVPEIKVDTYGRITSISNKTYTSVNTWPTKTSQLTNDSGFLTSHQSLAGYLPLSGGTMTGNIAFSNSGTGFRGINYGTMADNDLWRIGGAATASNAGYMEIATADDATEPIYARQYSGVFSTLKRTAAILDANGNTSFPGSVTGASFVKSGGTSALFLKADGSVDSNAYITGITKAMVTNALGYTPPTSDTNTWRGITDSYSGTDASTSLSQKGANALYNALLNGYASSAGTAGTASHVTVQNHTTNNVDYAVVWHNGGSDLYKSPNNLMYNPANNLLKSGRFQSTVATGTAPLTVASTTVVGSLNADLCDGLHVHGGRNNEANKIVRTDGNGYIQAGWINTTSGDMGTNAIDRIYCSNDGYVRYKTLDNFKSVLGLGSRAYDSTNYLPLAGGTVTGVLQINNIIKSYGNSGLSGYQVFYNIKSNGNRQVGMDFDPTCSTAYGTIGSSGDYLTITSDSDNTSHIVYQKVANNGILYVRPNNMEDANAGYFNTAGKWVNPSDKNLKYDITPVSAEELQLIYKWSLAGFKYFKWIDGDRDDFGVIAQEVETVMPDVVELNVLTGYKTVDYQKLNSKVIHALANMIDDLKKEITILTQKVAVLEQELLTTNNT